MHRGLAEGGRADARSAGLHLDQLYAGVGASRVMTNIAVWESAEALKNALSQDEWRQGLEMPPEGTVAYPVLVRKAAVPGICVA